MRYGVKYMMIKRRSLSNPSQGLPEVISLVIPRHNEITQDFVYLFLLGRRENFIYGQSEGVI
jgi:hypothetical protein